MSAGLNRANLSAAERNFRSRIAQLVSSQRLIRGSLSVRNRKCGKPNCRCATGKLHSSLYLVHSDAGHLQQIYVPKHLEERVRQAVRDYQAMQRFLEEISELEWKRLKQRKE
jgi:hypothetical protein